MTAPAPATPATRPAPPPRIAPAVRRAALEVSTVEGMFATAHAALTGNGIGGNAYTGAFALLLGAGNVHLGLLFGLPQLATAGQALAAYALQHLRSRRRLVIASCAVARSAFFLAPALPFALGREAALEAFIALFAVAAFVYQGATNPWTSWMSDLVPAPIRGRYLSRRSNACNVVGLLAGLAGGFALDAYAGGPAGSSPEADARRLAGFAGIFVLAAILGNVSTLLLLRQHEPGRAPPAEAPAPLGALVAIPFRDAGFRPVVAFYAFFSFANGLGAPFFGPFVLEDLGQSVGLLTLLAFLGGVAGLLTLPLWGRLLDRFGAKPCLAIIVLVSVTHPLYFIAARPSFTLPLYADAISSGIVFGGFNVVMLDLILTVAPEGRAREMYFAAYAGSAGVALAAGSVLGGLVADRIPGGRIAIFALVSALRLATLALLARMKEPGARPVGELLALARRALFGV